VVVGLPQIITEVPAVYFTELCEVDLFRLTQKKNSHKDRLHAKRY